MSVNITEDIIEKYLLKQAKKNKILCFKFTSPANNGVPDRILIGHGKTIFVEVKRPGVKTRELQDVVIGEMRDHGADVRVIDTKKGINNLIREMKEK